MPSVENPPLSLQAHTPQATCQAPQATIKDEDRLAALASYNILDSLPEHEFDQIAQLVSAICETPIALISLVDASRQWFKSRVGLTTQETPVEWAFCSHAMHEPSELLLVADATLDSRFSQNPLVTGEPGIRFYAGAPLITPSGHALGSLCVIDRVPRDLTDVQKSCLSALAQQVVSLLELRKANARTHTILQSITDAFLVLDRQWKFIALNPEAERLMGRSREELLGKDVWEEYPDAISTQWFEQYQRAIRDNTMVAFEVYNEGSQLWNDVRAYPSVEGLAVYFRDITNQKTIENTLRQSETLLEEAQRIAHLGSFEYRMATGQVLWSKGIYPLFDRDPALGSPTYDEVMAHFHPDDLVKLLAVRQRALQDKTDYECDLRIRQGDGTYRWVHNRSQFYYDERGIALGVRGTLLDIHERKQAEEKVQISQDSLKRAQSLAHIGSWDLDLSTGHGQWSDEMFRLYGLDPVTMKGIPPSFEAALEMVHPEDRHSVRQHASQGSEEPLDFRLVLPSSGVKYVQARSEMLRDEQDRPCFLRGTLMDITDRKMAELQIQEQMDQIHEANERLSTLATTDGLTGLKNHRTFQEKLSEEFARARRYNGVLSLLLLDVDHFKDYNDRFGHPAGDLVLKEVAWTLQSQCRACDVVARYGGEEFALILPETDSGGAAELAERIRESVERGPWSKRAVTISIGIVTLDILTPDEASLLVEADQALYQAKKVGRNCIVTWTSMMMATSVTELCGQSP